MNIYQLREKFEAWCRTGTPRWPTERNVSDGSYVSTMTQRFWLYWITAQLPCEHGHIGYCILCEAKTAPKCKKHGNPWYCGHCGVVGESAELGGWPWRLLTRADTIQRGDQGLNDDCETWHEVVPFVCGMQYTPGFFVPIRRAMVGCKTPDACRGRDGCIGECKLSNTEVDRPQSGRTQS